MTDTQPPTRERLLDATVALMRAKGAAATGTKEILDLAEAPRGSFYHHFPEGKDELVLAALRRAAAQTAALIEQSLAGPGTLCEQVRSLFEAIETDLVAGDYAGGCAVAVTTLESAAASTEFQRAVSREFEAWTSALTSRLLARGLTAARATEVADGIVAMMEGATVLARAQRDPAPLRHGAAMIRLALDALEDDLSDSNS